MPDRTAYLQSVEALLADIDSEIAKVRERAAKSEEPSRIQGVETDLLTMREEISAQLELIKRADQSDWRDFRLGIDNAREKLTMSVTRAMEVLESETGRG